MATSALSLSLRHVSAFAADVRESLTKPGQRELPSKYLYDEVGSALFETICVLPEYGLTRADARLLEKYAGEIVGRLPSPIQVAELGSGSGKKTRWILEALSRRQKTYYYPIEISPSALAALAKELGQIDMVSIVGYEQPYLEGLRAVAEGRRERDHRKPAIAARRFSPGLCRVAAHLPFAESRASLEEMHPRHRDRNCRSCCPKKVRANGPAPLALRRRRATLPGTAARTPRC